MPDKNMGLPIEGAPRINYLKGGGRTVAEPSPLAMRKEQAAYIAVNPVIDKDRVEAQVGEVRRRLGSKAEDLVTRAQNGNPWEVARAQSKIEELLQPSSSLIQPGPAPVVPIMEHTTTQLITPESLVKKKGERSALDRVVDKGISGAVSLYRYIASGEIRGLRFRDVDILLEDLRDPDRRETATHEVGDIVTPIKEKVKI